MVEKTFVLNNEIGLHARPAANFCRLTNTFASEIHIIIGNKTANAKSLFSVLSLGIFKDTSFTLRIIGSDEQKALASINSIISTGLTEES